MLKKERFQELVSGLERKTDSTAMIGLLSNLLIKYKIEYISSLFTDTDQDFYITSDIIPLAVQSNLKIPYFGEHVILFELPSTKKLTIGTFNAFGAYWVLASNGLTTIQIEKSKTDEIWIPYSNSLKDIYLPEQITSIGLHLMLTNYHLSYMCLSIQSQCML